MNLNYRNLHLLFTGFTVAILKCAAQQQTQPDPDAVKAKSEVIYVQPLTTGSNTSKLVIKIDQFSLKGMSSLMSYDARIRSAAVMGPLRFDYWSSSSGAKTDARPGRLGIEQAERMNLMQMNDYRSRNTTSSGTPDILYPSVTERMFNAR